MIKYYPSVTFPKKCTGCANQGKETLYTKEQWEQLCLYGYYKGWHNEKKAELRNCLLCQSTLSVKVIEE